MFDAARKDEEGRRWKMEDVGAWERNSTVCSEGAKGASSISEAAAMLESSRDTRELMRLAGVVLC